MTEETQTEHPNINRWWKHRRRMAYMSVIALIGLSAGAFYVPLTEPQSSLLQALCYMFGLIIGTYTATATWDDIKTRGRV